MLNLIRDSFCIQLWIQIVYIMFMMYTFCRSELIYKKCIQNVCIQNVSHISTNFCIHFVYKMYTKCIQNVCIQNVSHISTNFCIHFVYKQNLADIVLLILYTKYLQKLVEMQYTFCSIHLVEMQYTFCTHFVYISCIHLVQFLYKKFIHSFLAGC